ncbi:MAG TPA: DUF177 domain-containing protein [Thermoanaerobaculia bacterium]|nr:DUF177 domain-containing protein [Thermoanaerobaculia bacterium]
MSDIINFDVIDEHGPQRYHGTYEVPAAELVRDELAGNANMTIDAEVRQGDRPAEYVAEGTASLIADLECSRCVEPYPFAQKSTFHVTFRPRPAVQENAEIEIDDESELDVEFYTERAIPLRDLAVEQIQLSIPMKPLCEESCLGLCPTCGVNRTRETCACGDSVVDVRLGALVGIREQLAKKKDV